MSHTNDPISDLLTRIRNALMARHRHCELPRSKMIVAVLEVLKEGGYIQSFRLIDAVPQGRVRVYLKYHSDRTPIIQGLKRFSRPGARQYVGWNEIPLIFGGMGLAILSTSKGVISGKEARQKRVGGELLCNIW